MKFKYHLTVVAISAALSACAGTGEESEGGSASTSNPHLSAAHGSVQEGTQVATPEVTPSVQTADLLANDDFDFATSWDMDINFSLPLSNAYLSLCTEYKNGDNNMVEVQFDSCIVRAPISNGQFVSDDVPMTNEIKSIIAVLIDYSNPSSPLYVEFNVSPGKETLEWSEGVTI